MSMGLDSPMEAALAINYLSQLHGGVAANINYVWAWIAFLTAAVSFWKIKLSSSSVVVRSSLHQHLNSPTCTLSSSSSSSSSTEKELSTTSLTTSSTSNSKSSSSSSRYTTFCSMENRRSGKFSMYYYNNNNNNNNNSNDDEDDNTSNLNETDTTKSKLADRRLRNGCLTRHYPHEEEEEEELLVTRNSINYFQQEEGGLEWEPVLLKMKKTTEMVWYNYQDLSLLNGNVVRLWN